MSKPFCLAPWVNLNYTGTRGATVCCEWIGETYKGNIKQYYDKSISINGNPIARHIDLTGMS